jgi:hypothetical protein
MEEKQCGSSLWAQAQANKLYLFLYLFIFNSVGNFAV